jgi:hypothetical protein
LNRQGTNEGHGACFSGAYPFCFSRDQPNPGREKRMAVNELISKFDGGSLEYMDIAPKYLEADGTISKEIVAK